MNATRDDPSPAKLRDLIGGSGTRPEGSGPT